MSDAKKEASRIKSEAQHIAEDYNRQAEAARSTLNQLKSMLGFETPRPAVESSGADEDVVDAEVVEDENK
jgi:hypothetical protein